MFLHGSSQEKLIRCRPHDWIVATKSISMERAIMRRPTSSILVDWNIVPKLSQTRSKVLSISGNISIRFAILEKVHETHRFGVQTKVSISRTFHHYHYVFREVVFLFLVHVVRKS